MNVDVLASIAESKVISNRQAIADCDLHLGPANIQELYPFISGRWRTHIETYGMAHRTGLQDGLPNFPKAQPRAARRDAWPPSGRPPGTDIEFTREQHLDANNVVLGLINPPTPSNNFMNPQLGTAICHALNEYQLACLVDPEPRLRASVVVNHEDPAAAVKEIESRAGDRRFGHVLLLSRTSAPIGNERFFPILEAATRIGLPVAMHAFGFGGGPNTGSGWTSYYIEDMIAHAQSCQAQLTSLIIEGAFERLPDLRFVMIEGGFGWVPSLAWRLDKIWNRQRSETPHLRSLPSEYIRRQVWFTTQPMEEPTNPAHLLETIEWIGWDRLLFATDYPHWDFDDPSFAFRIQGSEAQRHGFLRGNALALYGAAA